MRTIVKESSSGNVRPPVTCRSKSRVLSDRRLHSPLDSDWLLTDNSTTWSGSPADRAWRFLRQSLERYDGLDLDYQYAKASLESVLQVDRSSPPPPWLVQIIEVRTLQAFSFPGVPEWWPFMWASD